MIKDFLLSVGKKISGRPKKSNKIENVIWQTTAGLYTEFELQYIQHYLLKDIKYTAIFDYNSCSTILDNSLIVFSNDSPKLSVELEQYFKKYDELGYNYWLLHLSNERLAHKHDFKYYKKAKHVFRGYYDPRIKLKNVTTIPIGFKSGFLNTEGSSPTISEREYIWSFVGQLKRDRKEMCDALLPLNPQYTFITTMFNSPDQLNVDQLIELYKKTVFIPCPMGYCNPDTFRLNEALEWGCIPVLKRYNNYDYYKHVYGRHPLILVNSWAEAFDVIKDLFQDLDKLEKYRVKVQEWYIGFKLQLQNKIKFILLEQQSI